MIIKWFWLISLFLGKYGESYYQVRNCPSINNLPHHIVQNDRVAVNITQNIAVNLTVKRSNLRAGVLENLNRWPKGKEFDGKYEVPYKFHENVPFETKEAIYFGMVIIERGTNIIFIKNRQNDTDYILFVQPKDDNVCDSTAGNKNGEQIVRIASWCKEPSRLIHELLHVIGMKHEHQRLDNSISGGTWDYGRDVAPDGHIKKLTPYDPFSIMHYTLPEFAILRPEDGWTEDDTALASVSRAFPSICDYSGINQIYEGHVQSPPCTNVRIRVPLLEATQEGWQAWAHRFPDALQGDKDMTWVCNYQSGAWFDDVRLFSYARENRTLCQFKANSMYPSFWWIPYAEEITYPAPGLDYSEFYIFPTRVKRNWMTHDICDCLGPPPFISELADHSMYQACLECIHFKDTTADVLECIAKQGKEYEVVLAYLQDNYNTTQYYLINPHFGGSMV